MSSEAQNILSKEAAEYKNLVISLKDHGFEVMFFHNGMGESCVFSMLMHAYKQKIQKPIILIALLTSRKQILEQCPDVDEVISCSEDIYHQLMQDGELKKHYQIKDFMDLHFLYKDTKGFKDEVCRFLELPYETEYVKYTIQSDDPSVMQEFFLSNGLQEGKTVFIVPTTLCYGDNVVSMEYWKKLTTKIKDTGRSVFFNSMSPFIEDEPYGFLRLKYLPQFVTLCGNVVGARTGLLDFIATFSNIRIQAIYPNESCDCWETNPAFSSNPQSKKELVEGQLSSMNMSAMLDADDVIEFVHDNDDKEIDDIIERLA